MWGSKSEASIVIDLWPSPLFNLYLLVNFATRRYIHCCAFTQKSISDYWKFISRVWKHAVLLKVMYLLIVIGKLKVIYLLHQSFCMKCQDVVKKRILTFYNDILRSPNAIILIASIRNIVIMNYINKELEGSEM